MIRRRGAGMESPSRGMMTRDVPSLYSGGVSA